MSSAKAHPPESQLKGKCLNGNFWEYPVASVVRVIDGDTVAAEISMGFFLRATIVFRLYGIDAPEMVGENKTAALQSKSALQGMLSRGPVRVKSYKSDSFGRWLGDFFVRTEDGTELHVNSEMVKSGFATPWPPK